MDSEQNLQQRGESGEKRADAPAPAEMPPEPKTARSCIYHDFAAWILITIVLMFFKGVVEGWEFGKQLEQMTYNLLQIRLLSRSDWKNLPVTVVDINGLSPEPNEYGGKTVLVTPRVPLMKIIQAVAAQNPRAIGIDLNLSPGPYGYMTPADPELLDSLLRIRQQGIPVFVGIFDSVVFEPGKWLGQKEYQPLAAYITVPNPEDSEPTSRMIEWVRPSGFSEPCYSLSHALAQTTQKPVPLPLQWAVTRATVRNEEGFAASEFLIDYAPLEQFIRRRVGGENAAALAGHREEIENKIVLVGRASPGQTADQFNVPGRGSPVPGIYVHAAATYTLLQAPLYRLTHNGRIAADTLAALLVFGPILFVRLFYNRFRHNEAAAHRLQKILTIAVIVFVLVAGHFLVEKIRLIWTDYIMVIGALLLHSPIERHLSSPWAGIRRALLRKWRPVTRKKMGKGKEENHEEGN